MNVASLFVLGPVFAVAAALTLAEGVGSESGDGGASGVRTSGTEPTAHTRFVTSVDRPRALLWAVGDGGIDTPEASRVVRLIARSRPDRLLYLGDVYPDGTFEDYEENYEPTYGRLASKTAPTLGNHEAGTVSEGYNRYWRRELGSTPPPYYAFRAAGWQILSLNSEVDHDPGSPQLRWLERRVSGGGTCRIAFWHSPLMSAGTGHGDVENVAPLWHGVSRRAKIVLNGHEHDMQRFRPVSGMTEFVSGAGGASLYPVDESDPRLRFSNDTQYGALRLKLRRGRARHAFVAPSGRVLDKGTIACRR